MFRLCTSAAPLCNVAAPAVGRWCLDFARSRSRSESFMSFQSLLTVAQRLNAGVEALAAISAELQLRKSAVSADPRVRTRLRDVIENIEPGLLDGLSEDQQAIALASINAFFRQALDLIDDPGR